MKKLYFVMALLIVTSMIITACGDGSASTAPASNTATAGQPAPDDWTIKVSVNQIDADTEGWKTTVSVFAKNFAQGTDAKLVWADGFEVKVKIGIESLPFEGRPVTDAILTIGNEKFDFNDRSSVVLESKGSSNPLDVFIIMP